MNNTQLLVRKLLTAHAHPDFVWTAQGLGMLRLYLSSSVRLHIWDSELVVRSVSTIHDHPWSFESEVVVGRIIDREHVVVTGEPTHDGQLVQCGQGGGALEPIDPVNLVVVSGRGYGPGDSYGHASDHLHDTLFEDGTVTLITRHFNKDTEHAHVYYPIGTTWVNAEPKVAHPDVVKQVCRRALEKMG